MTLHETSVNGVFVIEPERVEDERGFFATLFTASELAGRGIETVYPYHAISFNSVRWTLRGLHNQTPPHSEAKLVRCTAGRVFDVAVDVRADSPTYKSWTATELSAENRLVLAIPPGCVHGFLTLEDACELAYQLSQPLLSEAVGGIRWNDPGLDIPWPTEPRVISARDQSFPDHDW